MANVNNHVIYTYGISPLGMWGNIDIYLAMWYLVYGMDDTRVKDLIGNITMCL